MKYKQLGQTQVKVSQICLGTMTWGEQNTESEAHSQLDMAIAAGVNFIDTAEIYPVPPKQETYSLTETYIGNWLNKRHNRDQVVLATKVAGRGDWVSYIRDGNICFDRNNIEAALNASLKRLQTDYIDLYQLHWPDRNTNYFGKLGFEYDPHDNSIPIQETLTVLNNLVKSGKVRHIGLSNETPWGLMSFINMARQLDYSPIVSIQNPYNLLNRTFEIGLSEVSHQESVGLLAYSPLGFGVLSGKYLKGNMPAGSRLALFERFTRYTNKNAERATQAYTDIALEHELDPAQMALAYVNSRPFLTSNIIGATNLQQLQSNLDSIKVNLSDEILQKIEATHLQTPNPSP